jgi:hypothetical protein
MMKLHFSERNGCAKTSRVHTRLPKNMGKNGRFSPTSQIWMAGDGHRGIRHRDHCPYALVYDSNLRLSFLLLSFSGLFTRLQTRTRAL